MVAERLAQGFSPVHRDAISKAQEGFDDIEKARVVRQDGDIHPNGKWVWSSQAAGGKGDWRVIKKPKDGSPAPAPDKKETKSANAPALSSEALMKTLENMSAEDLIKLQSLIANAVAKKTKSADVTKESGEKMGEAIGSVLAQGIKATKRYNLAPDGSPIDLTKLPDQNIITAVVLVQENVDKLAYEATLGGGKKKQEKIAQELEDQRGKLAELQEEADRRGLKNEPSSAGAQTTTLNGHEVEVADGSKTDKDQKKAEKEFKDEVKRIVDESLILNDAAKARARKMLISVKDRFGDKVSIKLSGGRQKEPMAIVKFDRDLELGFTYGANDTVRIWWQYDTFGEDAREVNGRQFDVYDDVPSPIRYLNNEMKYVEETLYRTRSSRDYDEDGEFMWSMHLDSLKALKTKMSKEFTTHRP